RGRCEGPWTIARAPTCNRYSAPVLVTGPGRTVAPAAPRAQLDAPLSFLHARSRAIHLSSAGCAIDDGRLRTPLHWPTSCPGDAPGPGGPMPKRRSPEMKAKELMTASPACCTPESTAQQVAQLMEENDCGCIPVVEDVESRFLVGVITDRDLALRGVARGRSPETAVKDLMTTDVSAVAPDDDLERVQELMSDLQVRRVPVVDADGCCVGIIS